MKTIELAKGNFRRFWMLFPMVVVLGGMVAGTGVFPVAGALAQAERKTPQKRDTGQLPGFGKYRVVRIDLDGVSPQLLQIERGTTVIWYNATDTYSSVVFNEGESLNNSTRSPTLFFVAPDGTYVSAAFPSGGTSSTAFVRAGTFRYFVTGLPVSEGAAFAQVVVK